MSFCSSHVKFLSATFYWCIIFNNTRLDKNKFGQAIAVLTFFRYLNWIVWGSVIARLYSRLARIESGLHFTNQLKFVRKAPIVQRELNNWLKFHWSSSFINIALSIAGTAIPVRNLLYRGILVQNENDPWALYFVYAVGTLVVSSPFAFYGLMKRTTAFKREVGRIHRETSWFVLSTKLNGPSSLY